VLASLVAGCGQRHLPAGSQYAMAEVLLRHQLAARPSPMGAQGTRCPCYVLVGERDLPAQSAAALATTGASFLPGSAWSAGKGLRIHVGLPRRRWNGNFDVALTYDCGPQCVQSASVLMRYDGSRWRVIE
jgi:hypothetical protein